ncbi:MAG: hypothetical protein V1915_01985 [Candidatus Bathyarchaeota archaeon]
MGFKEIKLPDGRVIMLPMAQSLSDDIDNQRVALADVLQKSGFTGTFDQFVNDAIMFLFKSAGRAWAAVTVKDRPQDDFIF